MTRDLERQDWLDAAMRRRQDRLDRAVGLTPPPHVHSPGKVWNGIRYTCTAERNAARYALRVWLLEPTPQS